MAAVRRIWLTVALALSWLAAASIAAPAPASAHSVAGVSGTNYRTRLRSITPPVPGLTLKVIETGSRLELSNETGREAVVLGYQDEPYLRVGPAGVFKNVRSPATYLNATRKGTTPIPASASAAAPPVWKKTSSGTTARWHDHRIHWMGNQNPPVVRRAPGREHVVEPDWQVKIDLGGQTVTAHGDLVWVPGPSGWPWLLVGLALLGACVLAGRSRRWAVLLSGLLGAAVVIDVVHEAGIALANAGPLGVQVGRLLLGSFFSVAAWVVAALAVRAMRRPGQAGDGLLMAAFAGVVIALFGGLGDLPSLVKSQVPFAFAPGLARAAVGASLGLGLGLAAGSALAIVRNRVFDNEAAPEADPAAA
jgi:hypothetical protein